MSVKNIALSADQRTELFFVLKRRFEANMQRHTGLSWNHPQEKLIKNEEKLCSLYLMEQSGGEPDIIGYDEETHKYIFVDCAAESPKGRRSLCYDNEALSSRKENKPKNSAAGMAAEMGAALLDEAQYRELQKLGQFDLKTSSWIYTPDETRRLGGALFCDRRYGRVFVYHNGAESYYAVRGFRAMLHV